VFENKVLKRIFGPMMEELAGGWIRLHNEELHNFYTSPNIIRMIRSRRIISGACSMQERDDKCIQYFDWKT
jgi:hypothetical protein